MPTPAHHLDILTPLCDEHATRYLGPELLPFPADTCMGDEPIHPEDVATLMRQRGIPLERLLAEESLPPTPLTWGWVLGVFMRARRFEGADS